jgi:hypothetical protein
MCLNVFVALLVIGHTRIIFLIKVDNDKKGTSERHVITSHSVASKLAEYDRDPFLDLLVHSAWEQTLEERAAVEGAQREVDLGVAAAALAEAAMNCMRAEELEAVVV